MATVQLGSLKWRVDPTNVSWNYQLDTAVIPTLGGQVVQILGATMSDLQVTGDLGQDHPNQQLSWQLSEAFHRKIKSMMDAQVSTPNKTGSGTRIKAENTVVHQPYVFRYADGRHNWKFDVLIKGVTDADDTGSSVTYTTGKINNRYVLTLFIVQADSDLVKTIASDVFISHIAKGIGWSKSDFHGYSTAAEVTSFIQAHGGGIPGFIIDALTGGTYKAGAAASGAGSATSAEGAPVGAGTPGSAQDFFSQVLSSLGAPVSSGNLNALYSVVKVEGKNNYFNPMNSVIHQPGSTNFNSVGVQRYASLASGVAGTTELLNGSRWNAVRAALKGDKGTAAVTSAIAAVYGSWGASPHFPTTGLAEVAKWSVGGG